MTIIDKADLTLVDLLEIRAQNQGKETAYRFLKDGEIETDSLTYQKLAEKARAIATYLQALQLNNQRVIIIYPYEEALEFITAFFGCLYAQAIPVTCHPPLSRHGYQEIKSRMQSSQATAIITHHSLLGKLKQQIQTPEDSNFHWITTTDIASHLAHDWIKPPITPETLAFLQYTSGSTGNPKGVMLTHESVIYNQKMLYQAFAPTSTSIGVTWLPLFHDMGLIGLVIQSLYVGRPSIFMSPLAFIQKPVRWLQAISKYRGTISGAPNFAYDLLCTHVTPQQRENLDLSCWELAFSGAEPILAETIAKFTSMFADCGFKPEAFYSCYGMAEATLLITGAQKNKPPVIKYLQEKALQKNQVVMASQAKSGHIPIVSCGQPLLDEKIMIVNPDSHQPCEEKEIGEIWVAGSGIGKGYWQDTKLTQETFLAYTQDTQEGPFLRTGDLGFLLEKDLFITGRLYDVMVFSGLNHYPQLIEKTVAACHPALKANATAAFSVSIEGRERLIIAQEIERSSRHNFDLEAIVASIRWQVFTEHFVDVYGILLLKPGSIPKTSSGKIQRGMCKTKFIDNSFNILDQWICPKEELTDMTSVLNRYMNPITHLRRYLILAKAKLKSILKR